MWEVVLLDIALTMMVYIDAVTCLLLEVNA